VTIRESIMVGTLDPWVVCDALIKAVYCNDFQHVA
jgi:hypothetical protein